MRLISSSLIYSLSLRAGPAEVAVLSSEVSLSSAAAEEASSPEPSPDFFLLDASLRASSSLISEKESAFIDGRGVLSMYFYLELLDLEDTIKDRCFESVLERHFGFKFLIVIDDKLLMFVEVDVSYVVPSVFDRVKTVDDVSLDDGVVLVDFESMYESCVSIAVFVGEEFHNVRFASLFLEKTN